MMGRMALKHNLTLTSYPLSYYKDKKYLYLITAGVMFGDEKNKKSFARDFKKHADSVSHEQNGDFGIVVIRQPLVTEPVYDPRIIRPTPTIVNKNGFHIWDLTSFDRKALEKVLEFAEKNFDAKVLIFREEKLSNISFTKIISPLTKNQKKAIEIAIDRGYYEYPKKTKMETLADNMGISYSTFQAHLKKAEGKIIPLTCKDL